MINRGNMQNFSKNRAVVFPEWPQWDEHERKNLMRALQNRNWGTLGPMAMEFARRFAEYVGADHAVPVNSGTQAMQILLDSAGIGFGDEVIVPAYACPPHGGGGRAYWRGAGVRRRWRERRLSVARCGRAADHIQDARNNRSASRRDAVRHGGPCRSGEAPFPLPVRRLLACAWRGIRWTSRGFSW